MQRVKHKCELSMKDMLRLRKCTKYCVFEVSRVAYNHANSNLAIYSRETSQDKLSEA